MKHYFKLNRKLSRLEKHPVRTIAKNWSAIRCKRVENKHKMWHGWWVYKVNVKYNNSNGLSMLHPSLVGRKLREYIMNSTETL